ncbi:MAG: twin-arginine translocation signal domain-containing protein [Acidimicrobiales bacterium]
MRDLDRRQFLARLGVLGAAAAVGLPRVARADDPLDPLAAALQPLARDTINGLVAFGVPGPDPYSQAQGVTALDSGGVVADGGGFLMAALDNFYPLHDQLLTPLVQSLATGLTDGAAQFGTPLPLPGDLLRIPVDTVRALDDALASILHNDMTAPLSVVISLLLNTVATWVDPAAVVGRFPAAPFANLSYEAKIEAFRRMEEDSVAVAGALDRGLPEPLRQSLSGLTAFVAGALLEFVAFGVYTEWSGADRASGALVATPVGWQLSGYLAATNFTPVEGWDEFRGYYQGRTAVEG